MSFTSRVFYAQLVFIYLFAYGIKIYSMPLSIFVSVASLIYIFQCRLASRFIKIWKHETLLIIITFLYLFFNEALQGISPSLGNFSFYIIRILIDGILPAYVLAVIGKKLKINFKDFCYILIMILIFQFILAVLMIFFPGLKSSIFLYVADLSDESIWLNEYVFVNRGFGIAYSYLSWFPFAISLIFVFCLFGNEPKPKWLISILILVAMVLSALNARIGFIPIFIGMFFYMIFNGISGLFKIFGVILISVTFVIGIGYINSSDQLVERADFIAKWVGDDGFSSINSNEGSDTLKDLSNYNILLAFSPAEFIFGRGDMLTPKSGNLYTDVGYMQILYTGGLVLSTLLYSIFFLLLRRLNILSRFLSTKKMIPSSFIFYPHIFFFALLIGHFKLRIFEINEVSRFLLLIISLFIVFSNFMYLSSKKK